MYSQDQCIGYALVPLVVEEIQQPIIWTLDEGIWWLPKLIRIGNSQEGIVILSSELCTSLNMFSSCTRINVGWLAVWIGIYYISKHHKIIIQKF